MLELIRSLWPLILLIIALFAIAYLIKKLKSANAAKAEPEEPADAAEFPYVAKPALLSDGELAFYKVLVPAVNNRCMIMSKVGLSEIMEVQNAKNRRSAFNKIQSKQIDFVLCQHNSFKILAAIELDDRSHEKQSRRDRDEFLDRAFTSAQIPLLHFPAAATYNAAAIAQQLESRFSPTASPVAATAPR